MRDAEWAGSLTSQGGTSALVTGRSCSTPVLTQYSISTCSDRSIDAIRPTSSTVRWRTSVEAKDQVCPRAEGEADAGVQNSFHISIRVLRGRTGGGNTLAGLRLAAPPSGSHLAPPRTNRGPHATPSPGADQAIRRLHVCPFVDIVGEVLNVSGWPLSGPAEDGTFRRSRRPPSHLMCEVPGSLCACRSQRGVDSAPLRACHPPGVRRHPQHD